MNISNQYLAGFVDGEAYIGLIKKTSKVCSLGYYYKPNIKVTQRTKYSAVLNEFKNKYGGYLTTREQINSTNQNAVDTWEISNRPMVKQLLLDIREYSIVKKEHIELLLEFIELPRSSEKDSKQYDQRKSEIYSEMRKINKRGLAETKRDGSI